MRAFTLLETLIYIALFGIVMSGALTAISALTESADRNETHAVLETEGSFLLSKIDYDVAQSGSISAATVSNETALLSRLSTPALSMTGLTFIQSATSLQTSFTLIATSSNGQILSENFSHISYLAP